MANKRMFSLDIVDTDAFLEMPQSSQLLYFHLAMRADDEGFVGSPKSIMRKIGSADDDFKVLAVKKFIIPFESGICVIKHWLIHNTIRMDRFNPTNYVTEKAMLFIKENKAYKITDSDDGNQLATTRQPLVANWLPQVKVIKGNLSKVSLLGVGVHLIQIQEIIDTWNTNEKYPGLCKNTTANSRLFPTCRKITDDLEKAIKKLEEGNITTEDCLKAMTEYANEIINRDPKNDYSKHRFSLYEFLSQKNGFRKFYNK